MKRFIKNNPPGAIALAIIVGLLIWAAVSLPLPKKSNNDHYIVIPF